jgi:hypothetical protein
MLQLKRVRERPVEVVREIGYLLVEPLEGVAYDPPRVERSTSISALHDGHSTATREVPDSLIWR